MKLPAYPKYKPSGVDWLGEVPDGWEVKPLKTGVRFIEGPGIMAADFVDDGVPLLRISSIGGRWATLHGCNYLQANLVAGKWSHFRVRSGDVLISGSASTGLCSEVDASTEGAIPYTGIIIIRPFDEVTKKAFVRWSFQSRSFLLQAELARSGSTIQHFGPSHLSQMILPVPPLSEQLNIANFLDIETGKIDSLLAKKTSLIARLKEKRTALISRTVTRGLPPDAARAAGLDTDPKLEPSGIDWLGDVPSHWSTSRIKYVAQIESGHTPSRSVEEYWVDCTIPWVSLNDSAYLRDHDYISDTAYQISELGMANSSAHLLPAGAVVFSRDATVGLCAITTRPMAVSQHFIAYLCGPRLVPTYLLLVLKSMSQHLERLSMGATIPTIGMPDVRSLACPVPPVPEQRAIVDFVTLETARLDQLTAKVESVIDRLREYRTALITAAVTGKIDVRGTGND